MCLFTIDLDKPKIKAASKRTLDLSARDAVNITVGVDPTVLMGTRVTIQCPVQSTPVPIRSWKVKGVVIDQEDERYEFTKNKSSLTLLQATMEDSAVHSCVATNNAGDDIVDSRITVLGK